MVSIGFFGRGGGGEGLWIVVCGYFVFEISSLGRGRTEQYHTVPSAGVKLLLIKIIASIPERYCRYYSEYL